MGAGVVGLAVGAAFARRGAEVFVLEKTGLIGSGVSSRNSEVVHGGMYYPDGSLKAAHCVEGRRRLYAYCEARGIAHRRCGKLIVATDDTELTKIEAIAAQGARNRVEGLRRLSAAEATQMEPALRCVGALWSPETGIVDSHGLMLALQGEIEDAGGWVAFNTPVQGVRQGRETWTVVTGGAEAFEFECEIVVNAAGLDAWAVAAAVDAYPRERLPVRRLAKGSYFRYDGKPVFSRLIYPAPVDGGLGVHVTLDLGGRMRFGPDVEWVEEESFDVDVDRAASFYGAIRRYWPGLPDGTLSPDYAGIRPKVCGPGASADFMVEGPARHGLGGLVNLFGIESPGLTAALSLAESVVAEVAGTPVAA